MPILTSEERIGTVLDGKYRLDRVLGEGGMGVVYDGMHLRLERRVAVKFLHAQFSQSGDVVQRFVREAQATARLQHPNVVNVFDVDVSPDGCVFMVLEFLEGESLAQYLVKKPILDRSEMLSIIGPVCDALSTAHQAGIVHRDIKPDNIHLSRGPNNRMVPKVLDFGIAKLTDMAAGKSATQTGSVMGTPLYMSPEQAMGKIKDIGPWSDLWSTAVMTYECLCGQPPFEIPPDASPTMVILAIATGEIIPLSRVRPELTPVSEVLERGLRRNHTERHDSMATFYESLKRACEGAQVAVVRTQPGHVDPSAQMMATLYASPASAVTTGASQAVSAAALATAPPAPPQRGWMVGAGIAATVLMLAIAGIAFAVGGGLGSTPPPTSVVAAPPPTAPPTSVTVVVPPPSVVPPTEVAPPPSSTVATAEPEGTTSTHGTHRTRDHATSVGTPPATTVSVHVPPPPATTTTAADTHTHRAGGVSLDDF